MTENIFNNKILLVDDTPANIRFLVEALREDYELIIATSGPEALQLAATGKPDLILLDIMMPDMDGYEVCKKLKQDENTKDIPVIFVTAMTEKSDEEKGIGLGAVDYITKPFNVALTKARVSNHLELDKLRKKLKK